MLGLSRTQVKNLLEEEERELKMELDDAIPFAIMTADGTLNDCSIGKDCSNWITEWITEAKDIALRDNPNINYLAYTITL